MRRLLPLIVLLVAVAACSSPTDPARTSAASPSTGPASPSASGELPPGCEPPPDAAEGDTWSCVSTGGGGAEAEEANRQRLAAAARESPGWTEEDAQRADQERLRQVSEEYAAEHFEIAAQEEALLASGVLPADRGSLLIRTDFSDQGKWEALQAALGTPTEDGFLPYLSPVEHRRWNHASVDDLAAAAPPDVLLAVADATTFSTPEMPLLVLEKADDGVRQVRVAPRAMASVENNLSIANMDWEEFTDNADADGVFRGPA